jgi:superfamily II DNA or RNA helicase
MTFSKDLWPPQLRAVQDVADKLSAGLDVCLQSPTGSGKTKMAIELMKWADYEFGGACFYVNRKLLVSQVAERLTAEKLHFGVRSASYSDMYDAEAPLQICSADTERARVYGDAPSWKPHDCGLVVVDEAHIQKGGTMEAILKTHRSNGAKVLLLSATPVNLSTMADVLICGGTMQEYRECGAIVPAVVKSIEQPDMRKVKRSLTGEFVLDGKKRKIYTQTIIGNVIGRWEKYNPDARPTMLYAPGKAESVWMTQQFEKRGVRWCHVDATEAYLDGKRVTLSRTLWQEILQQYIAGAIKGISSRFKLREGIDVPTTYHAILATPIGSIQSFLQTVGRPLRAAEGKDHALITDHGGNYWRHGSPNVDRDWETLWKLKEGAASSLHQDAIRNKEAKEPIRCPECETERRGGNKCPICGHEHAKSSRRIIMENGSITTKEGLLVKTRVEREFHDTQEKWNNLYWGYKRKKLSMSFAQMEAYFVQLHGYWPPRTLNNMPKTYYHWRCPVHTVPYEDLFSDKKDSPDERITATGSAKRT